MYKVYVRLKKVYKTCTCTEVYKVYVRMYKVYRRVYKVYRRVYKVYRRA